MRLVHAAGEMCRNMSTVLHTQTKVCFDQWGEYLRKIKVQQCYPFVLIKLLRICLFDPEGNWLFIFLLNNP